MCVLFRLQLSEWDSGLVVPLEMLKHLNRLNKCDSANTTCEKYGGYKVPYNTFYVSELLESVDIRIDYVKWIIDNPKVSNLNTDIRSSNQRC